MNYFYWKFIIFIRCLIIYWKVYWHPQKLRVKNYQAALVTTKGTFEVVDKKNMKKNRINRILSIFFYIGFQ